MLNRTQVTPRFGRTRFRSALAGAAILLVACNNLLDVKNPNRIVEDDLGNPASSTAQANGLGHSVTRALTAILAPYSDATDELQYVGSRDSYDQLDKGFVALSTNEFVDASWPYVTEARFMANSVIPRLEEYRSRTPSALTDPTNLIRAYIYGGVIFAAIPDLFDDFVIATVDGSGRKVANPSIGHANLPVLYDSAIAMTTRALAMPEINVAGNSALKAQALGIRARAKFAKAQFLKTPITTAWASGPTTAALVSDASFIADAQAALAAGSGDWRLVLTPQAATNGFPIIGNDVNNRLELRAGDAYIVPSTSGGGKRVGSIRLRDPVDNILDPALTRAINSCCVQAVSDFVPITVVSAREMRLMLAEEALSRGTAGLTDFTTHINAVRAFETGLTAWTPASTVSAIVLLVHSRRVNLFLQGRRLRDMYRFGFKDPAWLTTSTAFKTSGCFLAITQAERDPNPNVAPVNPLCQ